MSSRIRLRFSKTGKAKFISHLDLVSTMRRALLRAGIRLDYSEGFNPHPYLSVALPLQVGCGSVCELMDFGSLEDITDDGARPEGCEVCHAGKWVSYAERINAALPEGLTVQEVYAPERKFKEIVWLEVNGELHYRAAPRDIAGKVTCTLSSKSIIIPKRTKRGLSDMDIAPQIRSVEVVSGDSINLIARISAQNPTITPGDLIAALTAVNRDISPDFAVFNRVQVFDRDMSVFR